MRSRARVEEIARGIRMYISGLKTTGAIGIVGWRRSRMEYGTRHVHAEKSGAVTAIA